MGGLIIFSKPEIRLIEECINVYILTLDGQWDPHSDVYTRNEEICYIGKEILQIRRIK